METDISENVMCPQVSAGFAIDDPLREEFANSTSQYNSTRVHSGSHKVILYLKQNLKITIFKNIFYNHNAKIPLNLSGLAHHLQELSLINVLLFGNRRNRYLLYNYFFKILLSFFYHL